ncbi:hypothetical protein [Faecalimicrobium sp. JNUCC 81]
MTLRKKLQKLASYISTILTILLGVRLFVFPIFEISNILIFNLSLFILLLLVGILYQYEFCCAYKNRTYKNIEKNTTGKFLIASISVIMWLFIFVAFYMELYRFL